MTIDYERLRERLRERLPPTIALAVSPLSFGREDLLVEEQALVAKAIDKRAREFATGRALSRRLLQELGMAAVPILSGDRRAPAWPAGIVGSITHTKGICIVALARAEEVVSVGIDVEEVRALDPGMLDVILTPEERPHFDAEALTVFSAKEAFYKFQYPLTQTFLDFQQVSLTRNGDRFDVSVLEPTVRSQLAQWPLAGTILNQEGLVITSMAVAR